MSSFEGYFELPETWDRARLKEICELIVDGTHYSPSSKTGPFKYITSRNIGAGKLDLEGVAYISENEHEEIFRRCPVQYGDLLLTKDGANTGNATINTLKEPFSLLSSVALIRGDSSNILNEYLLQFILSPIGKIIVRRDMVGLAITRLTLVKIGNLPIPLPPLPEQHKIAAILSTWDRAIELVERQIAAKQQLKRGLMQQLLTGKTRFGKFEEEWREMPLGKLGTHYGGLTGKTKVDFGSGKPFITYLNVFQNFIIDVRAIGLVEIQPNDKQNKAQKGDIFFTLSSETQGEVGMSSVLLEDAGEMYLNSFCLGFRLSSTKKLLPEFAGYLFRGDQIRKEIFKYSQGSTRFNLSKSGFLKMRIPLPPIEEQAKIASMLRLLDREIKALIRKGDSLRIQKRGLMQKLLTGAVRVKV